MLLSLCSAVAEKLCATAAEWESLGRTVGTPYWPLRLGSVRAVVAAADGPHYGASAASYSSASPGSAYLRAAAVPSRQDCESFIVGRLMNRLLLFLAVLW